MILRESAARMQENGGFYGESVYSVLRSRLPLDSRNEMQKKPKKRTESCGDLISGAMNLSWIVG